MKLRSTIVVSAVATVAVAMSPSAGATLLSTLDASAIIQSTGTDTDIGFLTAFIGFQPGQTLNYSSTSTTTAWSGNLSGAYLGTSLSVAYTGNLSAYPSGAVTWTSMGAYGTESWNGSGDAIVVDTSPTTFQVTFADSLAVGSDTASLNYVIPGTILSDGTIMYGDPTNEEVGTGTGTLNGMALRGACYSYKDAAMKILSDFAFVFDKTCQEFGNENNNRYVKDIGGNGKTLALNGTIETIPEPSSFLLLVVGLLGLASGCRYRPVRYQRLSPRPLVSGRPDKRHRGKHPPEPIVEGGHGAPSLGEHIHQRHATENFGFRCPA
jgi:hypothetical protein